MSKKIKAAIIGPGNIGTDLLMNARRSEWIEPVWMVGVEPDSPGLARAREMGLKTTSEGVDGLIQAISELLGQQVIETTLQLAPNEGQLRAELFALGAVQGEETLEDGTMNLQLKIELHRLQRLGKRLPGLSTSLAGSVAE